MSFEQARHADPTTTLITAASGSALDHRPSARAGDVQADRLARLAGALAAAFNQAELDQIFADLGRHATDQSATSVLWHVLSAAGAQPYGVDPHAGEPVPPEHPDDEDGRP